MTQDEKLVFIKELADNMVEFMEERLPQVPPEWDGIELRMWFVDVACAQIRPLTQRQKRNYRNAVLINNLA